MHGDDGPGGGRASRVCRVRVLPARHPRRAGLSPAGTGIAACHQRAPGLSRCTRAAIAACPPLVKAPRAHRLWVSLIDGPGPELRLDIFAVNVRLIYALLRRGVWTIPVFLHLQGVDRALPGESPFMGAARHPNPQHFRRVRTGPAPFYTSDPHGCAQQTGKRFPCPAGRQRVSVPVLARGGRHAGRGSGPGPDDIAGTVTWPLTSPEKAGTGCSPHALQGRRPAYPGACPLVMLIVILPAARLRYAQAAGAQSLPTLVPPPALSQPRAA